ncbi:hypothetical protein ACE41H_21300 [Paenibacillus enshidis]|uniref:HNH endonuclease n=1 Tax=Paenibacillus enshidis TaxID=1458439 RepID=A0ABV5AYK3_9BACL
MDYSDIVKQLKANFPHGTVQFNHAARPYIPNQVYTNRMETVTDSSWSFEIRELDINPAAGYIKAIVRVQIGSIYRDGYGVEGLKINSEGIPEKVSTKADQVINAAYINALDTWEMGWKDLAPHKKEDWGGNPALAHLLNHVPPEQSDASFEGNKKIDRKCLVCNQYLTAIEWELLGHIPSLNREVMIYCFTHLPNHLSRRLDPDEYNRYKERILQN